MTKPKRTPADMSLAEIEENIARMEEARRQCIEIWNRDIRAAKKRIEQLRNRIRTGELQPELRQMLLDANKKRKRGDK